MDHSQPQRLNYDEVYSLNAFRNGRVPFISFVLSVIILVEIMMLFLREVLKGSIGGLSFEKYKILIEIEPRQIELRYWKTFWKNPYDDKLKVLYLREQYSESPDINVPVNTITEIHDDVPVSTVTFYQFLTSWHHRNTCS